MTDAFAIGAETQRMELAPGASGRLRLTVPNLTGAETRARLQVIPEQTEAAPWFRIEGRQIRGLALGRETSGELSIAAPNDA